MHQQGSKANIYPSCPPKGNSALMSMCFPSIFNIFLIKVDFLIALQASKCTHANTIKVYLVIH